MIHRVYLGVFCYALQMLHSIDWVASKKLDEKLHYVPFKKWLLIVNDEHLGKSDIEFEFSEEGHKTCENFYDEKSYECESLYSEKKSHLVASASKSSDVVLRLCPILQVIKMAIDFLTQNTTLSRETSKLLINRFFQKQQ